MFGSPSMARVMGYDPTPYLWFLGLSFLLLAKWTSAVSPLSFDFHSLLVGALVAAVVTLVAAVGPLMGGLVGAVLGLAVEAWVSTGVLTLVVLLATFLLAKWTSAVSLLSFDFDFRSLLVGAVLVSLLLLLVGAVLRLAAEAQVNTKVLDQVELLVALLVALSVALLAVRVDTSSGLAVPAAAAAGLSVLALAGICGLALDVLAGVGAWDYLGGVFEDRSSDVTFRLSHFLSSLGVLLFSADKTRLLLFGSTFSFFSPSWRSDLERFAREMAESRRTFLIAKIVYALLFACLCLGEALLLKALLQCLLCGAVASVEGLVFWLAAAAVYHFGVRRARKAGPWPAGQFEA